MQVDQHGNGKEEQLLAEPKPRPPGKSFVEMDLTAVFDEGRVYQIDTWGKGSSPQFGKVRYEVYWRSRRRPEAPLLKVSMDLDNAVTVREAIDEAVTLINRTLINHKSACDLLLQVSNLYEFRLASKTGEPKIDYPGKARSHQLLTQSKRSTRPDSQIDSFSWR